MDHRRHIQVPILDLGCGGAGSVALERCLAATHGVLWAYVNVATETAYVDVDPAEIDASALTQKISRAGFQPGRPIES